MGNAESAEARPEDERPPIRPVAGRPDDRPDDRPDVFPVERDLGFPGSRGAGQRVPNRENATLVERMQAHYAYTAPAAWATAGDPTSPSRHPPSVWTPVRADNVVLWVVDMTDPDNPLFLFHRRAATMRHGAGKLAVISGRVEKGSNAQATAIRELAEEYAPVKTPVPHRQPIFIGMPPDSFTAVMLLFVASRPARFNAPANEIDPAYGDGGHAWLTANDVIVLSNDDRMWHRVQQNVDRHLLHTWPTTDR